jgi:hypothetical protein
MKIVLEFLALKFSAKPATQYVWAPHIHQPHLTTRFTFGEEPPGFFGLECSRNPCAKTCSKFFGLLSFQFSKVNKYYSCTVLRFIEQEVVSNSGQLIIYIGGFFLRAAATMLTHCAHFRVIFGR